MTGDVPEEKQPEPVLCPHCLTPLDSATASHLTIADAGEIVRQIQRQLEHAAEWNRKWRAMTEEERRAADNAAVEKITPYPVLAALEIRRLQRLSARLLLLMENPGPLMTGDGKPVTDPSTGEPVPDGKTVLAAGRTLLDVHDRIRRLSAPRAAASAPLEELQAAVARMRAEVERGEQEAREAREDSEDDEEEDEETGEGDGS